MKSASTLLDDTLLEGCRHISKRGVTSDSTTRAAIVWEKSEVLHKVPRSRYLICDHRLNQGNPDFKSQYVDEHGRNETRLDQESRTHHPRQSSNNMYSNRIGQDHGRTTGYGLTFKLGHLVARKNTFLGGLCGVVVDPLKGGEVATTVYLEEKTFIDTSEDFDG